MRGHQVEQIANLTRPLVENRGAFLVDLRVRRDHGLTFLEVFVDTDAGVTTELCAEISRDLSRVLDQADVIRSRYHLVVSSPGADRPMMFPRQYPRNIGRTLRVKFRGEQETKSVSGVLLTADDRAIVLRLDDGGTMTIAYDAILDARVAMPW